MPKLIPEEQNKREPRRWKPLELWLLAAPLLVVLAFQVVQRLEHDDFSPTPPMIDAYGHRAGVRVVYSPDSSLLATVNANETVKLWDVQSKTLLFPLVSGFSVYAVAFSPDGRTLAATCHKGLVLCATRTGQVTRRLTGHDNLVWAVAFSPDGTVVASGGDRLDNKKPVGGEIRLWNAKTGQLLRKIQSDKLNDLVDWLAFSPDGSTVLSTASYVINFKGNKPLQVWNPRTGKLLRQFHDEPPFGRYAAFSPDGKRLAVTNMGKIELWDTKQWTLRQSWPAPHEGMRCVAFSPDGSRMATGGSTATVVRDVATGQIQQVFTGRNERVHIPSDPPNQGDPLDFFHRRPVAAIYQPAAMVESVAFAPDGKTLASGCLDGTVKFWPLH